jgi:hypothetical protein
MLIFELRAAITMIKTTMDTMKNNNTSNIVNKGNIGNTDTG